VMTTTTLSVARCTVRSVMDLAGGSGLPLLIPAATRAGWTGSTADCTAGDSGAEFEASAGSGAIASTGAPALRPGEASAMVGSTIGSVEAQACKVPRITTPARRTPRLVG